MIKSFAVAASGVLLWAGLGAGAAYAQEKPQGQEGTTTIVIKDDTTPKLKKGARKVARHASIDVDTKDHVVTITGGVPTAVDRTRIGELVAHTAGVKSVVNNLSVQ